MSHRVVLENVGSTAVLAGPDDTAPAGGRTVTSLLASTVAGVVLGLAGVLGIAAFSGQTTVPQGGAIPADQAVLGGPEYGSRK